MVNILQCLIFEERVKIWIVILDTWGEHAVTEVNTTCSDTHLGVPRISFIADALRTYSDNAVKNTHLLIAIVRFAQKSLYLEVEEVSVAFLIDFEAVTRSEGREIITMDDESNVKFCVMKQHGLARPLRKPSCRRALVYVSSRSMPASRVPYTHLCG